MVANDADVVWGSRRPFWRASRDLSWAAARFGELDERKVGTERLVNKTSDDPSEGDVVSLGKENDEKIF